MIQGVDQTTKGIPQAESETLWIRTWDPLCKSPLSYSLNHESSIFMWTRGGGGVISTLPRSRLMHTKTKTTSSLRSLPKQCRLGEWKAILKSQQLKFEQIWMIHSRDLILQRFVWIPMSPSLDGNSARICDTTREQLSIDFVRRFLFTIYIFFLDINIPVEQVQS